ncbi:MAG: PAS domain S-box protein [Acidobacteriota bacterium]
MTEYAEGVLPRRTDADPGPREVMAVRLYLTSATFTIAVMAVAVLTIAAWVLDLRVLSGLVTIRVHAAVTLLVSALSVWLYRLRTETPGTTLSLRIASGLAVGLTAATLLKHFGWDVTLDHWSGAGGVTPASGRMVLAAALGVLLLHAAILSATYSPRYTLPQFLAGSVLSTGILGAVGYFFSLDETVGAGTPDVTVLTMALGLLLLGLAFFFARPEQGVMDVVIDPGPAGIITRQLVPVVFAVPPFLAWLSWVGVRAGLYEPAFANTLFVTLAITALCLAVLAGGRLLAGFELRRAAAEAQHSHSEERLRRAVTGAPIPMIIHDGDRILHMSRGWIQLSGYRLAEAPTVHEWAARVQPGNTTLMPYLARTRGTTDTVSGGEQTITTQGGETRVWEFSSTPLEGTGPDQLVVTMATDITERKQAEVELRRLNEELEQRIGERTAALTLANDALRRQSDQLREQATLLDLVRDGILVRDLYGTVVYWSAGAADMYGWARDEALGRVSHQLLQAEYPLPVAQIEQHVLATGDWEGEVSHRTRDGGRLLVASRWTLTRTERGTPEGFLEVNRDVTARKVAEDSLRDSEARFRAVAETAVEGVISVDEAGVIHYWNPGAERIFGRAALAAIGQPLATTLPDPLLASSKLPTADGAIGTTFETIGRRQDGSECPLELSLSSWTNAKGLRFFIAIVRDITERKAAERAIEAKADELARSNQELEQFAYVASHDLQEPLRMVSNYTQLLARRYHDRLDADGLEFIDFAVDGAKRMQDLIHDLLSYARVGTRGKEFRAVATEQIVADAMANLSGAIDEASAEVVVDPLPTLICDASQMVQVFQNLIANAVKFRRPGTRPSVRISASRGGHAWTIEVADNGIGIEAKYFDRIFQMFQRLHGRGDYPGTGIGLALCKKIIERHGGRIRVESTPGTGTTFSFTIPDAASRAA